MHPSACRGPVLPGGTVLAVHWLGRSADHRQHGSAVHDQLEFVFGAPQARRERGPDRDRRPDLDVRDRAMEVCVNTVAELL